MKLQHFYCLPIALRWLIATAILVELAAIGADEVSLAEPIDFNRDVRPILSNNCYACHGFDENAREANLRLDTQAGAVADLGGYAAVVPGKPDESELIARIVQTDPELLMPPPDSHKKALNPAEVKVLRQWIAQGAAFGKHWAFEPPVAVKLVDASVHPVDYFVQRRWASVRAQRQTAANPKSSMQALPDAARRAAVHVLARRLAFDLTGLPPTLDQVDALGTEPTDADWNGWIDRLLDSPHYGERMAMWWLDGARYSDTDGFQQDAARTNWPWRDWVVDAFNAGMPFDQFTIEQFAGDLLPEATDQQKLATCFHRNHMHNGEGGRDPAESRVDYVLDRTNTVGTLWLGLTLGCTQCHDHKFDPISQRDYYSLTAYFDSIDETGAAGNKAGPFLSYRSAKAQPAVDESKRLVKETALAVSAAKTEAEKDFAGILNMMVAEAAASFEPWRHVVPSQLKATEGTTLTIENDAIIRAGDDGRVQDDFRITAERSPLRRLTGVRLEIFADPAHRDQKYSYAPSGEFLLTNVKLQVHSRGSTEVRDVKLVRAVSNVDGRGEDSKYGKVAGTLDDDPRTGWTTRTQPVEPAHTAVFELAEPLVLSPDEKLDIVLMQRSLAPRELIGRFRLSMTDQRGAAVRSLEPMPMQQLAAAIAAHDRSSNASFTAADIESKLRSKLLDQFLEDQPRFQSALQRDQLARDQLKQATQAAGDLKVTVLSERKEPRKTHILVRGEWDQHGQEVAPNVLPVVAARDQADVPTRHELAQWIVARDNPLTARVIVNQIWQLFFGAGLVRTPNDFGLQGESPTHPQLLDWLAVDFMESRWDVKHLVRRIVTSRTYQQDSAVGEALLQFDPENRWLVRGARFRLPSWMIRDAYLHYSGLLNRTVGGPPVFPYQPPGVWNDQFMGRFTYTPSIGPAQYRRTLYSFWRRSSPPTFLFDTAMRRTCEVTPRLTNTPLQALTLMNGLTSLEAARRLSDQTGGIQAVPQRLERLFRIVLSRPPNAAEAAVLRRQYDAARQYYTAHGDKAVELTAVGQLSPVDAPAAVRIAAGMIVAGMILNLDESITHE